jgi:hypothetical protein
VKSIRLNFENRKIEDVFSNGATTSGRMDKWRSQLDSARQIGLEPALNDFLIVG